MRIVGHPFVRLGIALVSLIVCVGLVRSIVDTISRRNVVSERQEVLNREEELHAQLEEKLREATSAAFIEKQAREKLGLVKEGETVVLLGTPAPGGAAGETKSDSGAHYSQWKKWWSLFF